MSEKEPKSESEPILSFEEFGERDEFDKPRHRNFYLHFGTGMAAGAYQQTEHYKRFAAENSELNTQLLELVKETIKPQLNTGASLETIDNYLYEAYKIMRGYGASDEELFT